MLRLPKLLVLLFALATQLTAKCGEGCLSCHKNSPKEFECKVCDMHNGYTLNTDKVCVKSVIENCQIQSSNHSLRLCLKCKDGHVLDLETETCVPIPSSSEIEFCDSYLTINHCEFCEEGYSILDGICAKIEESIDGCLLYNPEGTVCLQCRTAKHLKENKCLDFKPQDKCFLYTEEVCAECKEGYVYSPDFFSFSPMTSKLAHKYILANSLPYNIIPPFEMTCIERQIPHCISYINFNQCSICENGYYLDSQRTCQENPANKILNCEKYLDESTCLECSVDYFLNANLCQERTKTDFCSVYEITSSTCLECDEYHFLMGSMCIDRVLSKNIEYCAKLKTDADECETCKERFVKTDDNLACLIEIPHCNTYEANSSRNTDKLLCNECLPGYYISELSIHCLEQFVENCQEYLEGTGDCKTCIDSYWYDSSSNICSYNSTLNCSSKSKTSNTCDECNLGFYLTDGRCFEYSVTNCQSFSSNSNKCEICNDGYFLAEGDCHLRNNIGCEVFKDNSNECNSCVSGYYTDDNNICVKQYIPNCSIYESDSNNCFNCDDGYYVSNGLCLPSSVPHCLVPNINDHKCSQDGCEEGFYTNSNGYCLPTLYSNCETFDDDGNCETCKETFYLSGTECLLTNVTHCSEYTLDTNTCVSCNTGYYLKTEQNVCLPQNMVGCDSYTNNTSLECSSCLEGYYLDSNNNSCVLYDVWGCDTYNPNKNACASCATGYFLSETNGSCVSIDIEYCATGNLDINGLPECQTCINGYLLDAVTFQCVPETPIKNCVTEGVNGACTTCAYQYKLDGNGECVKFEINNCISIDYINEECLECENKYILNAIPSTCDLAINSYKTDGINTIEHCEAGYTLSNNICTSKTSTALEDSNCAANNTTSDNDCSICNYGFTLLSNLNINWEIVNIPNCNLFDYTTNTCIQCEDKYELQSDQLSCTDRTGEDLRCHRKEPTVTSSLDSLDRCIICGDLDLNYYYDTTELCIPRTLLYDNAFQQTVNSQEVVVSCHSNTVYKKNYREYSTCLINNNYNGTIYETALDASCKTISYESIPTTAVCDTCEVGYIAKATAAADCDSLTGSGCKIYNTISLNGTKLSVVSHQEATASVTNLDIEDCYQTSSNIYLSNSCSLNTKIHFDISISNNNIYSNGSSPRVNYSTDDSQVTSQLIDIAVIECADITTPIVFKSFDGEITYTDLNTVTDFNNCLVIGMYNDGGGEVVCQKCSSTFLPVIVIANTSNDLSALTNSISVIQCQDTTNDFEKNYESIYNESGSQNLDLVVADFFYYDSCKNGENVILRLHFNETDKKYSWLYDENIPAEGIPGAYCSSVPFDLEIYGCLVYIASSIKTIDNLSDDKVVHCGSCAPGYKALYTDNKITACEKIPNCDLDHSDNIMPGGCKRCNEGYFTGVNENLVYDWTNCVQKSEYDENCEIPIYNDSSIKHCLKCKSGYNVSLDALYCSKIDLDAINCTNFAYETNALFHTSNTDILNLLSPNIDNLHILFKYLYPSTTERILFGCDTCKTNPLTSSSVVNVEADDPNIMEACLPKAGLDPIDGTSIFPENCNKMLINDTFTCDGCIYGYTFNENDKSCTEWSGENMYVNRIYLDGFKNCENGYKKEETDNTSFCVEKTNNNKETSYGDPCAFYNGLNCIRCKNGSIPINITASEGNEDTIKVICSNNIITYQDQFKEYIIKYHLAENSFSTRLDERKSEYKFIKNLVDPVSTYFNHICLPENDIPNCSEMKDGIICSKCEPGYLLEDAFSCVKGPIEYCLEYSNKNACSKCEINYHPSATNGSSINDICQRNNVENCLEYYPYTNKCSLCKNGKSADENNSCGINALANCAYSVYPHTNCLKCDDGFNINKTSGLCEVINSEGCMFALKSTNICRMCSEGYYLEDGDCKKYTFKGCKIYNQGSDSCIKCKDDYYLDNTLTCKLRIKKDCGVFSPNDDKCLSCSPEYYFDTDNCIEYNVSNCMQFDPYNNACLSCQDGYRFNSGKCLMNSDISCKKFSKISNICIQCEDDYFYNQSENKCLLRTNKCKIYNPNTDSCFSCFDGYYLSNNICSKHSVSNCEVKSYVSNKCISCQKGFWLTSNGECKLNTSTNCILKRTYSNTCQVCSKGYYLNKIGLCAKYTVSNCDVFNNNNDSCLKCTNGYFRTSNGHCNEYSVKGCFGYVENANRCANCQDGHYLFKGECIPYNQKYCLVFTKDEDSCVSCTPKAYKDGKNCRPYSIDNCAKYNKMYDGCIECDNNHYLMNHRCHPYNLLNCKTPSKYDNKCKECIEGSYYRNANGDCVNSSKIDYCSEYHKYLDQCNSCEDGYYLKDGLCHKNPSGVTHCVFYHSNEICGKCKAPYYLINNECVFSEILIENCAYYTHNGSCGECDLSYFLEANKCHPSNNDTCLTWIDKDNCQTCNINEVRDTTGSNIKCVPSGIDNCYHAVLSFEIEPVTQEETSNNTETNTDNGTTENTDTNTQDQTNDTNDNNTNTDTNTQEPNTDNQNNTTQEIVKYVCKKCSAGHYLVDNQCKPTSEVENCSEYESETLCSKCNENYTLSIDKKECTEGIGNLGEGCSVAQKLSEPRCSVCEESYYLKTDGTCHKCSVDGCAICDSSNIRKCKLCKNGYQMNELFYCFPSVTIQQNAEGYSDILEGTSLVEKTIEYTSIIVTGVLVNLLLLLKE